MNPIYARQYFALLNACALLLEKYFGGKLHNNSALTYSALKISEVSVKTTKRSNLSMVFTPDMVF